MSGRQPAEGPSQFGYDGFAYGRELAEDSGDEIYDDEIHDEDYGSEAYEDETYDDEGYYDEDGEDLEDDEEGLDPSVISRRRFMAGLAVSGAAGYTAFWALGRGDDLVTAPPSTTTPPTTARPTVATVPAAPTTQAPEEVVSNLLTPAPVEQRVLVLIELEGGNDGPSTVVPAGVGAYYDLRPNMAVPADQVIAVDDQIGLNPNLAQLAQRQFSVVEGVGPVDGTMSHFEMVARWEQGDLHGDKALRTGFLGRVADAVDTGSPMTALSVKGFTPRFSNVSASTMSLENLNQLRVLTQDDWIYPAYRQALTSFHGGPMTTTVTDSFRELVSVGGRLPNDFQDIDEDVPMVAESRDLGRQLATAAELLRADLGVRVVHARLGGFDTHKGHQYKHERLMKQLDFALAGFLDKLDEYGLADRVLVATSSEFGRRASENGNGLDHGAASTMLLFGPVLPGRHGDPSPFNDLDQRGNLKTTVPFDVYLGTLAETWLGVEAASVLPTSPELLPII